jgi:hypothetical protein
MSSQLDTSQQSPRDELRHDIVSLYQLGLSDDGAIVDVTGEAFDPLVYSSFKYGDLHAATRYAKRLARRIVSDYGDAIDESYVSSSAYKQVPTAAAVITDLALAEFSILGHEPAGLVRIDRGVVLTTDYAAMSIEERQAAMSSNGLEINSATATAIRDRDVIVIDDVRITGSHERAIAHQLGTVGVRRAIFGYVAVMDEETALNNPRLEDAINSAKIKQVTDLRQAIDTGNFRLNARTCKFILNSDPEMVTHLFGSIPLEAARSIVTAMIADGYHAKPEFADTFDAIQRVTSMRSKTLRDNPMVLEEVVKIMRREGDHPAKRRFATLNLAERVRGAVDAYAEKRHAALQAERLQYETVATTSYERYNAKINDFVKQVEQAAHMVKIKFDSHGLIDRTWLAPTAQKHVYLAVSLRREMEEELFTARAMLMRLPENPSHGIDYTDVFHYEKFLDPKDVDSAAEVVRDASKLKFPKVFSRGTIDLSDDADNVDAFTPGIALLWSVFPDFAWTRSGGITKTNSTYFQYENGKPVRCLDA